MISPSTDSPAQRGCPRCGTPLSANGDEAGTSPCGACLLLAGLGEDPLPLPPPTTAPTRLDSSAPPDQPPSPDGCGLQLGGHLLVRELGRGSMGVIYEARQPGTGRLVALKTIARALLDDPDVRSRFAREAETAASLDHPHILPVYEVGEDGGRPFFTMKLAEGGNLLRALPRYAARPREAVALLAKVARGVAHAHARGVLHRDLKPGNVLLDADGETPLVSDFGLARWLARDSDLTQSLVVFGTPGYLAPEQARHAGRAGPAADVYGLGAMLFQLLCGRTPFRGGNAIEVIEQAAAGPAPPLRSFNPKASRDLETICARCLEIEPERRPKCAADLADDLERWLEGRPIRARRVMPPERAWRLAQRNPWLSGAAAGCLLLGVAAGIGRRESLRLNEALRDEAAVQYSVAALLLERLDEVPISGPSTPELTKGLLLEWQRLAPDLRIESAGENPAGVGEYWRLENLRQIRDRLRSPTVLAGTVRQQAGRTRLALRLINSSSGDVFARWFGEVSNAGEIAGSLELAVTALSRNLRRALHEKQPPPENLITRTASPSARDYLHYGRELYFRVTPGTTEQAIGCFRKAIEADPNYAFAHAMLATALCASAGFDHDAAKLDRARSEAETALRLAPDLAEAHRALGMFHYLREETAAAVECDFRAYELDPGDARIAVLTAYHLHGLGRPDLALPWFERATRRQSQPGSCAAALGDVLTDLGEDDAAEVAFRECQEFRPGMGEGTLGLSRLWLMRGDCSRARQECELARAQNPTNPQPVFLLALIEFFDRRYDRAEELYRQLMAQERGGGGDFPGAVGYLSAVGWLRCRAGEMTEGRALLEEARTRAQQAIVRMPDNPRLLYQLAATHAALGERQATCVRLYEAIATGWTDYRSPSLDPRFDSSRETPEFRHLLERLSRKVEAFRRSRPVVPLAGSPQKPQT